jgi:hypothetical protein
MEYKQDINSDMMQYTEQRLCGKLHIKITIIAIDSKHPTASVLFKWKVKRNLSFRKVRCQEIKLSCQNIFLDL